MSNTVLGIIPARLESTRLPRKVLRTLAGETLLAWVVRAARACPELDDILVAVDSPEVASLCAQNDWPFILTAPELTSGTDRLHAVSLIRDADIYVNIQGDEPLLCPGHITALLAPFAHSHVDVTTLKVRCHTEDIANPNAVKVVTAIDGRALYFSRSSIPFDRSGTAQTFKHIGLYAYRRAALERFAMFPPSPLELTERLEQLRLLENNIALYVSETEQDTIGVDTEADLLRVEAILNQRLR